MLKQIYQQNLVFKRKLDNKTKMTISLSSVLFVVWTQSSIFTTSKNIRHPIGWFDRTITLKSVQKILDEIKSRDKIRLKAHSENLVYFEKQIQSSNKIEMWWNLKRAESLEEHHLSS